MPAPAAPLAYATVADLLARFSQQELLELTDPHLLAVDEARLQARLDDAQATIDGWIGQVYRLPLEGCAQPAPVPGNPQAVQRVAPPQLTRIACDLARFWLRDAVAEDSDLYRRYRAAMAELEAIAQGRALLSCPWGGSAGQPLGADAQSSANVQVLYHFSPRCLRDEDLQGY